MNPKFTAVLAVFLAGCCAGEMDCPMPGSAPAALPLGNPSIPQVPSQVYSTTNDESSNQEETEAVSNEEKCRKYDRFYDLDMANAHNAVEGAKTYLNKMNGEYDETSADWANSCIDSAEKSLDKARQDTLERMRRRE